MYRLETDIFVRHLANYIKQRPIPLFWYVLGTIETIAMKFHPCCMDQSARNNGLVTRVTWLTKVVVRRRCCRTTRRRTNSRSHGRCLGNRTACRDRNCVRGSTRRCWSELRRQWFYQCSPPMKRAVFYWRYSFRHNCTVGLRWWRAGAEKKFRSRKNKLFTPLTYGNFWLLIFSFPNVFLGELFWVGLVVTLLGVADHKKLINFVLRVS